MGLIKGITDAVIQKAKNEMKEYILKVMEDEKQENDNFEEIDELEKDESDTVDDDNELVEIKSEEEEEEEEEIEEINDDDDEEDEDILPLVEQDIIRLTYKTRPEEVAIPKEILEILQYLSFDEFTVYIKLFIFCCDQKKNYGYLGNTLRKKTGLIDMDQESFDRTIMKLGKLGLIKIENVSDNQRTFVLYIPFNHEINTKVDAGVSRQGQKPHKKQQQQQHQNSRRKNKKSNKDNIKKTDSDQKYEKNEEKQSDQLPGIAVAGNEDEDLYKSYRTYVNLEIDKAKMRVGRSNFDKIYMEAVKYIDKNFGFKVLSDSDKFKEYLTSYYISAFDIKTFEEWKKDKP
jgi:hypothetical protein